ncbi:4,5-DOPA dioxygenase extradiol [Pseudocercospora fuligena]|uniref:4,5-DOPA dioxygenase extradiol n=1 Tax=Pseudocercospora fuligena TaxID=685502 RepID=A0A8H6VLE0_9PEZI|nr:4,5-DOPA dioxygenase extradiol [Pseudocercospora fuligena]
MSTPKTPVYFLSIGGPNFMEQTDHPAFHKLGEVGREITTKVQPKAVVVISAHWEGSRDTVKINVAEHTDIIYDFFGFPPRYYRYKFPNRGSPEIADQVIEFLEGAAINVERAERGLDHGVWVSLFADEDVDMHYRLGQALAPLRQRGIMIVGAGMAVHNLNDFRRMRVTGQTTMPYASSFDELLSSAVAVSPDQRQKQLRALLKTPEAQAAHPTKEHIMPLVVAAGAATSDRGKRLWTYPEGSLIWAQYRFGELHSQ